MGATSDESFARLGLSAMKDLSVRFLIMPSDPDDLQIRYDDDFWKRWESPPTDPFADSITAFGSERRPVADAAVVYEPDYRSGDEARGWRQFASLSRAGEFEFGLTTIGATSSHEQQFFFLMNIVGRIWVAASRYAGVVDKFDLQGPFEASLALVDTAGSILSNFATEWRDPIRDRYFGEYPICLENHLLFRREISQWPDAESCEELVFEFAERMLNSWGIKEPRFLARSGQWEGKFDISQYSPR